MSNHWLPIGLVHLSDSEQETVRNYADAFAAARLGEEDAIRVKLTAERDELVAALSLIAESDEVDAALDPQRAVRVARAALAKVAKP
jgi:hypothetical protein